MRELEREHIGDKPPLPARVLWGAVLALGAPTAFLATLNFRYLLVRPACDETASRVLLELGTLIVLVFAGGVVWRAWRIIGREFHEVDDRASQQPRFVATAALLLGALSLLAGVALWLPSLFLSPCGRP